MVQCSDRRPEIKFRKVPNHNKILKPHDAVLSVQTADGSGAAGVPGEVTERGFDCHRPAHSRRKPRDVSACIHRTVRLQRKLVALHRPRVSAAAATVALPPTGPAPEDGSIHARDAIARRTRRNALDIAAATCPKSRAGEALLHA